MESRDDLKSILAYLPVLVRSTNLFWPSKVVEALKEMAQGPDHSRVNSGEVLFVAICDMEAHSLFFNLSPLLLLRFTPSSSMRYKLLIASAFASFCLFVEVFVFVLWL